MALNPTFASASVNPSQSIGSDASAPAQGALPTGMPQNTGFSGLGQQPQQMDFGYTSPFMNQGAMPDSNLIGNSTLGQQPQQQMFNTALSPNYYVPNYMQQPQGEQYIGASGTDFMPKALGSAYEPQYTMPLNKPSPFPDTSQDAYQIFTGQQSESGNAVPSYQDWSNGQMNQFVTEQSQLGNSPYAPGGGMNINYVHPKEPVVPMIPNFNQSYYQSPQYQSYLNNMPQYASDDYRMMPFGGYGSSTIANLQNQSYEDFLKNPSMAQQPQAPYNNGQLRYDSGDTNMPQVGNLGNDVEIPKLNYLGYKPGWQQEADNTWSYNTENFTSQNNNDWGENYLGYRGVPNDAYQKYQDALSRGEAGDFSGDVMNQYTATTKPRYTTDFSQLGLSQTALDSLKNRPQDLGSYYYDTQTGMFNQGAGRPGPNIPGQRIYTGMTDIPLDVMNKLGSGEEIDFSPYKQYTNGFNIEGQPNPPQIGDQPLPEQQPQVFGYQVPYEDPRATIGPTFTQRNPLTPTATPTGTTPMATNPLSTYATTPTTGSTPAPTLNVTPGASSSGSFGQGGVLPNVTTTQQQVTAAPSFYTDYLNQLATRGGQAAQDAQYVGAQPLQEQAFNLASQNVGNYQPTLQNAINLASSVGNTNLAQAIGDVGQANIARNLAPQATAGIVGSGQFGSKRGAQALGDVIANAQLGLTAQQQQAMQQDMANRIAAAQQLGTLANSTQQLGLGDVNALSTLGQQQQTIAQNQQLFPMQQLANQSALLRGYTIPTSVSASQTGPGQQGQFQTSPLQQIMSVGTLLGALAKPGVGGTSAGGNLYGGLESLIKRLTGGTYTANPSTNTTTSTSIGDVSASMKTLPDGRPNPNYDAYADPNATDADRMAQNLLNSGNPGNVLFDDGSDVNDSNVYDYSNYDPDA